MFNLTFNFFDSFFEILGITSCMPKDNRVYYIEAWQQVKIAYIEKFDNRFNLRRATTHNVYISFIFKIFEDIFYVLKDAFRSLKCDKLP